MNIFKLFLISLSVMCFFFTEGQNISLSDTSLNNPKILLRKERSGFLMIHTGGFGIGYRSGKHITGYKKRIFEIEFTGMKDPKEIRTTNPYYQNTKSYIYGKENVFFIIRAGLGNQKVINSKPYWGGVELRYFYSGGLSLGLLKPVYLYILNYDTANNYFLSIEKYDPNKDFAENIFGRAPFFQGFGNIKPLPGLYFKTGLNFEYGAYAETVRAIETGITIDAYPKAVPIMAYPNGSNIKNKSIFLSLYLSFHFGVRKN